MSREIEKMLSRLEKRLAEKTKEHSMCNCRVATTFHGGDCLDAILKGIPRVCPLHGFRELGFFMWGSKQYTLLSEDNPFCPCPPHPWRSFLLSPRPHTWEGRDAAREACSKQVLSDDLNLKADNRKEEEVLAEYFEARHRWVESGGRLPDKEELVKLAWKRARKRGRGR
jgi:hypothetical protein